MTLFRVIWVRFICQVSKYGSSDKETKLNHKRDRTIIPYLSNQQGAPFLLDPRNYILR